MSDAILITDGKFQIEEGLFTGPVLIPINQYVDIKTKRGGKDPVDGPHIVLTCPIPTELCPRMGDVSWLIPGETIRRLVVLVEFEPGVLNIASETPS